MTLPQHVVQSGLICLLIPKLRKWYISTVAVFLTVLPDVGRLLQSDPSDWTKFYRWAHSMWYCYFIPFWNIHIAEDYLIHQPGGGWLWWANYIEILLWILESVLIFILIKRNDQNQKRVIIN